MANPEQRTTAYAPHKDRIFKVEDADIDSASSDSSQESKGFERAHIVEGAKNDNAKSNPPLRHIQHVRAVPMMGGYAYYFVPPAYALSLGWNANAVYLGNDDGSGQGLGGIEDQAASLNQQLSRAWLEYREKGIVLNDKSAPVEKQKPQTPADETGYYVAGAYMGLGAVQGGITPAGPHSHSMAEDMAHMFEEAAEQPDEPQGPEDKKDKPALTQVEALLLGDDRARANALPPEGRVKDAQKQGVAFMPFADNHDDGPPKPAPE